MPRFRLKRSPSTNRRGRASDCACAGVLSRSLCGKGGIHMAIFRTDSAACPTCPYGHDAERRRNRSVYNGRPRYIALIKDVWGHWVYSTRFCITAGWVNLTRDVVYLPSLKYFGPQSNLRATFEMAPHPSREWDTLRQRPSPSRPDSRPPKQARARAFSLDVQIPYCFLYLAGYVRKGGIPPKTPLPHALPLPGGKRQQRS